MRRNSERTLKRLWGLCDYYSTLNHCPTGDGYVVVGSADGQIRLYSERTLTRANTAIPGLGAPITAVDVTYDGKWVLATTATYLMVVLTTYKARALNPKSGLRRSCPAPAVAFAMAASLARLSRAVPALPATGLATVSLSKEETASAGPAPLPSSPCARSVCACLQDKRRERPVAASRAAWAPRPPAAPAPRARS